MFGFLAPRTSIPAWRQAYARICQHQRRLFGLSALPFLSYEATFLYQTAIDFLVLPPLPSDSAQCCRLKRLSAVETERQLVTGRYAATFGLLLLGVKLQDDVQDSGRWHHHLLHRIYRQRISAAEGLLTDIAPTAMLTVRNAIERHSQMERESPSIPIEQYAQPTGDAFAAIFQGLAEKTAPSDSTVMESFSHIGRHLGHAIIAFDCAVDFEHDRIRGEYNPLPDHAACRKALQVCQMELSRLGWMLPSQSTGAVVVASVAERIRRRMSGPPVEDSCRRLERWGVVREHGYTYARCDGCDVACVGGECCGDIGAAIAAPDCAGRFCCEVAGDGCFHFGCNRDRNHGCHSTKVPTSTPINSAYADWPYREYHGRHGKTVSALTPTGFVEIDGERIPAKSMGGEFMEAELPVKVTYTDSFGVGVIRLPPG
ncbi:MAG: hypothetical protein KDA81_11840 [Planctomycetaceae bacterium]|nr:hypothetical protein [Planctomycetaceae bacterium]